MADKSKIEWTDATWNPIRGCSLVSSGCTNCYAMRQAHRLKPYHGLTRMTEHGPVWTGEVRLVSELLSWPLKKKKPLRIFVNSMSDLFHESVPTNFIDEVMLTIALARRHVFQLLTKRPERMKEYFSDPGTENRLRAACRDYPALDDDPMDEEGCFALNWPIENLWLGISVEDQKTADERIPLLLQTPAAVRWISAEPLLGPVNLYLNEHKHESRARLNWVVCGGESGPRARPMHTDWVCAIRDQCRVAGVAFFFKQWGEWATENNLAVVAPRNSWGMYRVGKKAAGHLLDGREWREYPK